MNMKTNSKKNNKEIFLHSIQAFILCAFLLSFYTYLFLTTHIIEWVYFSFTVVSVTLGLVICFRERIREVNLTNGQIVLEKARELIHESTIRTIELIATLSAYSTGNHTNRKRLNDEIESILTEEDVDSSRVKQILNRARIMERYMRGEVLNNEDTSEVDWIMGNK